MRKEDTEDAHFTEGEEEARRLVADFLRKLIESTEVEAGFKVRLMMSGTGQEVLVTNLTYDLSYDVLDFAEDVVGAAVNDVQSHRGAVKYAVRCFVGGRERCQRFRLNVPRTEAEEEDEFGEDSLEEAPTRRGLAHQQMRHAEVLMREHRHGMVLIVRSLEGQLHSKDQRIRELEGRLREYQDREEDVSSLKWIRELETDRIKSEEDRKAKGLQMLQAAVPMLLAQVTGQGGAMNPLASLGNAIAEPPEEPKEAPEPTAYRLDPLHVRQDVHLDAVFSALTPEHVRKLVTVLPDAVVGHLSELHRCCEERYAQGRRERTTATSDRNGSSSHYTPRP